MKINILFFFFLVCHIFIYKYYPNAPILHLRRSNSGVMETRNAFAPTVCLNGQNIQFHRFRWNIPRLPPLTFCDPCSLINCQKLPQDFEKDRRIPYEVVPFQCLGQIFDFNKRLDKKIHFSLRFWIFSRTRLWQNT